MATTLVTLTRRITIGGKLTQNTDNATVARRIEIDASQTYTHGTGANQANEDWDDQRTVTAASENLDLAGGITNGFGRTVTFTSVKELFIKNTSTTSGENLTISGSFMDNELLGGTTPTMVLGPGGVFHVASPIDGYAVAAGTDDIITIDPGSDTIIYDIEIVGVI